jgi:hypothetical protein
MWISSGIQYLAQLAQHALFQEQMALPTWAGAGGSVLLLVLVVLVPMLMSLLML